MTHFINYGDKYCGFIMEIGPRKSIDVQRMDDDQFCVEVQEYDEHSTIWMTKEDMVAFVAKIQEMI